MTSDAGGNRDSGEDDEDPTRLEAPRMQSEQPVRENLANHKVILPKYFVCFDISQTHPVNGELPSFSIAK